MSVFSFFLQKGFLAEVFLHEGFSAEVFLHGGFLAEALWKGRGIPCITGVMLESVDALRGTKSFYLRKLQEKT